MIRQIQRKLIIYEIYLVYITKLYYIFFLCTLLGSSIASIEHLVFLLAYRIYITENEQEIENLQKSVIQLSTARAALGKD
jgi:hypothetical protein